MIDDVHIQIISQLKLDSHTNVVVLGKECFVFKSIGRTYNVEPF